MPAPISTINVTKEQGVTYAPLLLATFTFSDGAILRLSTHPLNAAEGGVQYNGQDYLGRIREQDIAQVQAIAETGIDLIPSVTLTLSDPDAYLYTNFERAHGFRGATLELRFVFYDVATGAFSSDSRVAFIGTCDTPSLSDLDLTVSASAKTQLTRALLPVVPIQRRCPWKNPTTTAQRAEASSPDSPYYECGETRDLATAPPCSYTRATCTQPLRFGGITWEPPEGGRGREYVSGDWINIKNAPNEARYGQYFPMVYGTAWVDPPVLNVVGDGNYTRGEVVVCVGEVGGVYRFVVNDVELSPANSIDGTPYTYANKDFRFNWINKGDRDGSPNLDVPYNGNGDPYGSLAALMFVVPRSVADSASIPRVRVLVRGPKVRVYTDPNTYTEQYSENPVWILLDMLVWTNYRYDEIDIATFISAASYCDELVSYTDENGNLTSRPRHSCSLVLRDRRSAVEVIRGIRQNAGLILVPSSATGLLQVFSRQTLAKQQAAPVSGSNYDTPVPSVLPDGTSANGYVAYRFDSSAILRRDRPTTLREIARPAGDAPNRISFQFQDRAYNYAQSSISVVETDDVARMGREIAGSAAVAPEGITSYDQAFRQSKTLLAELHRGNEAGDTRGTRWFEFETTFRAVHLRIGQIVSLNAPRYGLSNQLVRIAKIQPARNYETVRLTVSWHDDQWYTDAYATTTPPGNTTSGRRRLNRPPLTLAPAQVAPSSGDPYYDVTEKTFSLTQDYESTADGKICRVGFGSRIPINQVSPLTSPPIVPLQANVSPSGGSLAGERAYFLVIAAKDSNGVLSALSQIVRADIANAGNTFAVTINSIAWQTGTNGWALFAGVSPQRLTFQSEGSGLPSSITLTSFKVADWGAPDQNFDHVEVDYARVTFAGHVVAKVANVSSGSITLSGVSFNSNEWNGFEVSLLASATQVSVPVCNFSITANNANTLTVTPNPVGKVSPGDVVVIRVKPSVSGKTFTDAKLALEVNAEKGRLLRIIAGAGRGESRKIASNTATSITVESAFSTQPDSTSRFIIVDPTVSTVSTPSQVNSSSDAAISSSIEVANYLGQVLLFVGFAADETGRRAVETEAPSRELYITGVPVASGDIPGLEPLSRIGERWHPNSASPAPGDPLYAATEKSFGLNHSAEPMQDGSMRIVVYMEGSVPANSLVEGDAPTITDISVSPTGGSLPGDTLLYISVCARDASGRPSNPSDLIPAYIPSGTNTNKLVVSVTWPTGSWTGYLLSSSVYQKEDLTGQLDVLANPLPATIELPGPLIVSTFNHPNPYFVRVRLKGKRLRYPGQNYQPLTGVAAGLLTVAGFANNGEDYTGRTVSIVSDDSDGSPELWNYSVTAYNTATGEFTVAPDPTLNPFSPPQAGDMLVVNTKATLHTSTTIGDSLLTLVPNAERENLVRILFGKGKGQVRRIISNDAHTLTVDSPWDDEPDTTSVFVIELANWEYISESASLKASDWMASTSLTIPVANYPDSFILLTGVLVDSLETESLESISPMRVIYVKGDAGSGASVVGERCYSVILDDDDLPIEADVTANPFRFALEADRKIVPTQAHATVRTAPVGGDLIFDILYSDDDGQTWNSIFPTGNANKLIIADGEVKGVTTTFAANVEFLDNARMRLDIIAIGTTTAGGGGAEVVVAGLRVVA